MHLGGPEVQFLLRLNMSQHLQFRVNHQADAQTRHISHILITRDVGQPSHDEAVSCAFSSHMANECPLAAISQNQAEFRS